MKTRFRYFFQTLFTFVLLFIIQKPLFMLFHITLFKQYSFKDWLQVPYHALWQDISIAACLTLIPSILLLITIWSRAKLWRRLAKIYFFIVSLVITIVFILDSALYSSVGSHIRATQWSILQHTPKALLGHLSAWAFVGSVLGIFIIFALVFRLFYFMLNSNQLEKKTITSKQALLYYSLPYPHWHYIYSYKRAFYPTATRIMQSFQHTYYCK